MPRVKRGVTSHRRHKKLLKLTKGHRGVRSKLVRRAKESSLHAFQYAFAGRKQRRRDMRKLWITQLSIALKNRGLSYSKFINNMKAKNIQLDRKILSDLAVNTPSDFEQIISRVTSL